MKGQQSLSTSICSTLRATPSSTLAALLARSRRSCRVPGHCSWRTASWPVRWGLCCLLSLLSLLSLGAAPHCTEPNALPAALAQRESTEVFKKDLGVNVDVSWCCWWCWAAGLVCRGWLADGCMHACVHAVPAEYIPSASGAVHAVPAYPTWAPHPTRCLQALPACRAALHEQKRSFSALPPGLKPRLLASKARPPARPFGGEL